MNFNFQLQKGQNKSKHRRAFTFLPKDRRAHAASVDAAKPILKAMVYRVVYTLPHLARTAT